MKNRINSTKLSFWFHIMLKFCGMFSPEIRSERGQSLAHWQLCCTHDGRRVGVGVMRDKEPKLEEIEASHTLGETVIHTWIRQSGPRTRRAPHPVTRIPRCHSPPTHPPLRDVSSIPLYIKLRDPPIPTRTTRFCKIYWYPLTFGRKQTEEIKTQSRGHVC